MKNTLLYSIIRPGRRNIVLHHDALCTTLCYALFLFHFQTHRKPMLHTRYYYLNMNLNRRFNGQGAIALSFVMFPVLFICMSRCFSEPPTGNTNMVARTQAQARSARVGFAVWFICNFQILGKASGEALCVVCFLCMFPCWKATA